MDCTIVLDISAVIWDETHFNNNKKNYYGLADGISRFINKLNEEKLSIFMRTELLNEIFINFPYERIPRNFSDFETQTISFLEKISPFEYSAFAIPNLVSIPNQIKAHYNNPTKDEVFYLLSKIHSDSSLDSVYFTFEYLWKEAKNLKTKENEREKEYKTIISDKENELEGFFIQFKPVFEHNPKHDKTSLNTNGKWKQSKNISKFRSQLSCYNERNKDKTRAQELLDSAYKYSSCYYNYDDKHDVFIVFRNTRQNEYHGYDENDLNKIPNEVRKHFNK